MIQECNNQPELKEIIKANKNENRTLLPLPQWRQWPNHKTLINELLQLGFAQLKRQVVAGPGKMLHGQLNCTAHKSLTCK